MSVLGKNSGKNGKIELWRFLFCIIIMTFHIGDDILGLDYRIAGDISLFSKGQFAVEFFFVLSGFLMASSAFKNRNNGISTGRDAFNFMRKKLMAVLPYHLLVFFITFAAICILGGLSIVESASRLFQALPNFFLISRSGLAVKDVLGVEWYIADMLIAMLILYPICRRYYDVFTKIAAPVGAIMIIGYLIKTTGSLAGSTAWSVLVAKTFLRAFSEICAGAFTFELCRNIKKLNFSKVDKIFLSLLEVASYVVILAFMIFGNISQKYAGHTLIFVCIAICLSFSGLTFGDKFLNNKFIYFLGSLSLPLYLCQSLARRIAKSNLLDISDLGRILVFFVISFAMTFTLMPLEKKLRKAINDKMKGLGIIS